MDVIFDCFDDFDISTINFFLRKKNLSTKDISVDLGVPVEYIEKVIEGVLRPHLNLLIYFEKNGLYLLTNYQERLKKFYYGN